MNLIQFKEIIILIENRIQSQYLNSISMSQQIYKPKYCAFHPKQLIFNFCKNQECLLPLCPSCIRVHTQEHRADQTYGLFQNMSKVVLDLNGFFQDTVKELDNCCVDIKDHQKIKQKEQLDLKKKIQEAKSKMLTIVERFFTDFQKEVTKSIICYNESMKENYGKVVQHIQQLKQEIGQKTLGLGNEKVLKVLIGFHAKQEQAKYNDQVQCIKNRIIFLDTQKVEVVCQPAAIQAVISEMGNYIHLSFTNWQHQIKYVADFVKEGMMSTGEGGFASIKA